ncbi:MAG: Lin0512 family protein [Pseudomonadota bacterium]
MAKKRVALEIGFGTSLRRADYTAAAKRAVENALWRNSLTMAQAFGFDKSAMIVDVDIAVQQPADVDTAAVAAAFPYGQINVSASHGGLDIDKPDGDGKTVIANAAISVSFDMEPA